MRSNFSKKTIDTLAKRVGYLCSNPDCQKLTIGPNDKADKSSSIGVAAHLIAASSGGPRANHQAGELEIKGIDYGIWLCNNCSSLIDRDETKYTIKLLKSWKKNAEIYAESLILSSQKVHTEKINFDGYMFDKDLEATWAAFFKEMNWSYVYKPLKLKEWQPKFQIQTQSSFDDKFLVDVIYSKDFNINYRKKIANATDYAKNILILDEQPFKEDGYPNTIGLTSLPGKIENDDQEYCTSIIYDFYGEGLHIHNLCSMDSVLRDLIDFKKEFCSNIWKQCKNKINSGL